MSGLEITWRLIVGLSLVLANAFFVAAEFSLTRLRQLDRDEIENDEKLKLAWRMTEKLEIYLTGCQLGISSTSILLGIVAEPAVTQVIAPVVALVGVEGTTTRTISVVVGVILINLIHKIWGEQAPTYLGVERPKWGARYLAPVLYAWSKVMHPLIIAGDGLAKLTLRMFGVTLTRSWVDDDERSDGSGDAGRKSESNEGKGRGSVGDVREELLDLLSRGGVASDRIAEVVNALEIDEIPAREIMVPRGEMQALDAEKSLRDNLDLMIEATKTRYPLVAGPEGEVIGTVYVPAIFCKLDALLAGQASLRDIAVPPLVVDADCPVSELIDRLQEEHQELALLEDDGEVVGMVTATDAFEAIAGDLDDPLDEPEDDKASRSKRSRSGRAPTVGRRLAET